MLDADVSDCFGSIDHGALMAGVAGRVSDRQMLRLIGAWLRAGVLEEGVVANTVSGTPQGSPISPLLANVALHVLDTGWEQQRARPGVLIRYADDFVVLCPSRPRAEEARRRVAAMLAPLGLQLRPAKTRVVCLTDGAEGFDFLGFHQHKVESWRWRGRWYLQRWPSSRALLSVRAKIRSLTDRKLVGWPVEAIVAKLNRSLRGWAAYFRHGNSARKFDEIDRYVHERLAIWATAKHGRHGRNWQHRHTAAWLARLGVYRLSGQVRYETAHASR